MDEDRESNGFALGPITHTMIKDWAYLNSYTLMPFEVRALKAVDKAYRIHSQKESNKDSKE